MLLLEIELENWKDHWLDLKEIEVNNLSHIYKNIKSKYKWYIFAFTNSSFNWWSYSDLEQL